MESESLNMSFICSIILEFIIETRTLLKVKGNTITIFPVQPGEARTILGNMGIALQQGPI